MGAMRKRWTIMVVAVVTLLIGGVYGIASNPVDEGAVTNTAYPALAAHRGGAGVWPQNTMTAFRNAEQQRPGVALEMDVQALKDGTLVIFHDDTVNSLSANGATGKVKDLTLAQWKTLRIKHPTGGTPAPAATLAEVLNEFGGKNIPLLVELKDVNAANKFVETLWPYRDQVIVQSFDPTIVSRMVRTGFHTLQLADNSNVTLVKGIHSVGVQTLNITPALVTRAHNAGVKVWAWGNEVTADMVNTDTRGVDGFIANDPTT